MLPALPDADIGPAFCEIGAAHSVDGVTGGPRKQLLAGSSFWRSFHDEHLTLKRPSADFISAQQTDWSRYPAMRGRI